MATTRRNISELTAGMTIDQVFLIRDKDLRTTRNGDLYILCTLCDKSGALPARMWQASEGMYNSMEVDGFMQVKGRCEDYRGNLQLIIDGCRPHSRDKVNIAEFMPTTSHDIEEMWAELLELLRSVKNKHLRMLVKKFIEDHDFVAAYKCSPAAMQMHHPFVGGLLEHTLGVMRAAQAVIPLYPQIDGDLLLVGAFMHDMGKTAELTAGPSFNYTVRGQLVGHITMAVIWIHDKAAAVAADTDEPFPQNILDMLEHLILAHHGAYEYGSPKLPAMTEAFVLHYLDNLDAKMYMTANAIEKDPDANSPFTGYVRAIETRVYKGRID